jgi:hypothetical protein
MERTLQALEKLAVRVAAGRLKKAQKIGEVAARILARNHGSRLLTNCKICEKVRLDQCLR